MTARGIKRRNAKRMRWLFHSTVWWLFGTPAHRKAGEFVALASITFRSYSGLSLTDD